MFARIGDDGANTIVDMCNNDGEARVPLEHVFDASATFALFVDPRYRSDVDEEEAIARREFVVNRIETLVVAGHALNVFVKLETGAARVESGAKIVETGRVVGMNRRERNTITAKRSSCLHEPGIQLSGHARAMRVAAEDEALDTRAA